MQLVLRDEISIGVRGNSLLVQLIPQPDVPLPDFAVVRVIDPLLNLQLEQAGMAVFNNSEVARIANDKALAHIHAATLGVPMADTVFVKRETLPDQAPFDFPFVLKQTDGRSGNQVFQVNSLAEWREGKKSFFPYDSLIQKSDVIPGKDVRIFVIGKEIVAAVLRENKTDFRANISLGGRARLYELSSKEKELAERFIKAFDFGLVGIDFLFDPDGNFLFNEFEDPVGSRSLSQVSSINLLEHYVSFIKNRLGAT